MVKDLDEKPGWPDHVGWSLWRASHAWQQAFVAAMQAAGHAWMTDARAALLGHVGRAGTAQSALIERMGISKQAVQQLVDGLEAEGILYRDADPRDRRARIVRHTEKGRAALRDANRLKLEIEDEYRHVLGEDGLAALKAALAMLLEADEGKKSVGEPR
ncbi:MarR family winged helix-turn-helix transcriptional regulator [Nitratireductor sp. ZSWI3]|uniref:MarR family winged helix-turn-helix transcriptional regulator n=1 Tax=Nitratireductor sp. ZSWI3 TaxID=2966359 RepID=UPI0021504C9C|nr:MarR family transcriptional regulator [Nitratireductor sp. ZSWI3]MCR4265082.1 MarR family transcriptional regulator [Nitratireductor sp. ZSWI3]